MTSTPHADADSGVRDRIRQQEVVAELGQQALDTDDLDQLMHDASVAVAETLDNEYAKVLELLPSGTVFLRQGVGWRDGLVGNATVVVRLGDRTVVRNRTAPDGTYDVPVPVSSRVPEGDRQVSVTVPAEESPVTSGRADATQSFYLNKSKALIRGLGGEPDAGLAEGRHSASAR